MMLVNDRVVSGELKFYYLAIPSLRAMESVGLT